MPAGRPQAMTREVRQKVLYAIKQGNYREVAAQYAGVCPATLRAYLKKREPEAEEFLAALLEAEAKVEIELVGAIQKLAQGDLKAGTWYLSRKFPKRWSDQAEKVREALKLLKQFSEQSGKSDH